VSCRGTCRLSAGARLHARASGNRCWGPRRWGATERTQQRHAHADELQARALPSAPPVRAIEAFSDSHAWSVAGAEIDIEVANALLGRQLDCRVLDPDPWDTQVGDQTLNSKGAFFCPCVPVHLPCWLCVTCHKLWWQTSSAVCFCICWQLHGWSSLPSFLAAGSAANHDDSDTKPFNH